jgi:hypothetical protein
VRADEEAARYSASIFQIDSLMPGESILSVVKPSVANQVRGP